MKEKITLIYSNFDENTGVSVATIETALGRFTGKSVLREEDKKIASTFCGCRYAELKAVRQYLKALLRVQKAELQTLNNLFNAIYVKTDDFCISRESIILSRSIENKMKEIQATNKGIKDIGKKISNSVAERDKMLNRIQGSRAE